MTFFLAYVAFHAHELVHIGSFGKVSCPGACVVGVARMRTLKPDASWVPTLRLKRAWLDRPYAERWIPIKEIHVLVADMSTSHGVQNVRPKCIILGPHALFQLCQIDVIIPKQI